MAKDNEIVSASEKLVSTAEILTSRNTSRPAPIGYDAIAERYKKEK